MLHLLNNEKRCFTLLVGARIYYKCRGITPSGMFHATYTSLKFAYDFNTDTATRFDVFDNKVFLDHINR